MKIGTLQILQQKSMNKFRLRLAFSSMSFAVFIVCSNSASADGPTTDAKLNQALVHWRTITPDTLRLSENNDLLLALRALAKDRRQTSARVPLIKLGDQEVIQACLDDLRSNKPSRQAAAATQLQFAANPEVIPLLVDDLNTVESPNIIFRGDISMLPASMAAASIIKATLVDSPVFSDAVKQWAGRLPVVTDGLRNGIRIWWQKNKEVVLHKDYAAVVPGDELK